MLCAPTQLNLDAASFTLTSTYKCREAAGVEAFATYTRLALSAFLLK
jgi:hypothetical protein